MAEVSYENLTRELGQTMNDLECVEVINMKMRDGSISMLMRRSDMALWDAVQLSMLQLLNEQQANLEWECFIGSVNFVVTREGESNLGRAPVVRFYPQEGSDIDASVQQFRRLWQQAHSLALTMQRAKGKPRSAARVTQHSSEASNFEEIPVRLPWSRKKFVRAQRARAHTIFEKGGAGDGGDRESATGFLKGSPTATSLRGGSGASGPSNEVGTVRL
jgi:hypothetical protein